MKRALALVALSFSTILFSAAPPAFAGGNVITMVSTHNNPAQDCVGSLLNQYSNPGASNLCWSGTGSGNYAAFSLNAMEAGVEVFPLVMNNAPTLELYNDTGSTTVSLKFVGTMGANDPITCQSNNGSTGCEISGPLGTVGSPTSGNALTVYGPSSSSSSWPATVTVTFYGVPLNTYLGLQWSSWTSTDESGVYLGGQVPDYGNSISSCSGNPSQTTVTGTVYAPNGVDPLPNALVYIPNSAPGELTSGVQCMQAGSTPQGGAITSSTTAANGTFTLTGVPSGTNIPIVIQLGKWRIQRVISTVTACASTPLPALASTLPSNQYAGDIPKIAIVTGSRDAAECVLRKTGILDSEFTNATGAGRINFYLGGGSAGSHIDSSTPGQEALVGSQSTLNAYDMVLLPSQGGAYVQTSGDLANVYQWANSGGRLFASHDSFTWLAANPTPTTGFGAAAQWDPLQANPAPIPGIATVDTSFSGASTLSTWMGPAVLNASTTSPASVNPPTAFLDQSGVIAPTQSWLTLNNNTTPNEPAHPVMQLTFNTPVGSSAPEQCGRVLYTEYHAEDTQNASGVTFPSECDNSSMTAQEHLVEYSLFDLSNAITPVVAGSIEQAFTNTPSSLKQNDSADQIKIDVTNASPSVALASSLQVSGTLPTGVTVNTSSFSSGGWTCASSSGNGQFTCTRATPLAANTSDAIDVPVSVAADAPTGSSGSLTDTISGGGLPSAIAGTDPLTITTASLSITCATVTTGEPGVAFNSGAISVSGGTAPYTYSVLGTLPAGLTLNTATGTITGTPTAAGAFAIQATDTKGATGTAPCPITILPSATGSCSLGLANGYNLMALTGNISDPADITGRIAAAGQVTEATTIGTDLRTSDPYAWLTTGAGGPWAIVAGGGIPTSGSFNINAGGNVYSSTPTNATFNFANENYPGSLYAGSSLLTGGSSPIDFPTLSAALQNLSGQLSGMTANGVTCSVDSSGSMIPAGGCPANPIYFNPNSQHYNPSWIVLYGTSATTNIFNITQAQFQSLSNNLDIEVPTGSTVIINVDGASDTLQSDIYFQGSTVTDAQASGILFNFAGATSVTINGQMDATVLAPNAALSGISQMGGVFIAASIGSTGEVHYDPFGGSIPGTCSSTTAPLSVTCAAITTGEVGIAFDSGPMTVTGGTGPYTYSIVGTLPAGLTLNPATGAITGTPTAAGTFSVKVTDAKGATGTACPITINAPLSVNCAAVTTGEAGVAFNSGPMTLTGGTAPYTYSIVGTVPAGLVLNTTNGAITGTPTAAGIFSVKVTDANGATSTACAITIDPPLSASCAAVTTGEVGIAFNSGPMTVTGGTAPYTYSIVGTLPAGLILNTSNGAITGTPTANGIFSIKVTDAKGATSTACPININASLSVGGAAVSTGEAGLAFNSGPITVTGGTAPYTYSIVGNLPTGLVLNTSTGAITGTATAAGNFSVKVTDANGATGTAPVITINAALSATCAAVTTGEVSIAFSSGPMTVTGGTAPYTYSIVGTLPAGLTLNTSTGAITGTPTANGTFTVKVTDAKGATSAACAITINTGLSVSCAAVTTGQMGAAFNSGPMTVSGGTVPYTYSIVGTLPAGLTLNTSTGSVAGTPTASGTFSVSVTDARGASVTACAITVAAGVPIAPGDTATIGFWHNKNGQALINAMNGDTSATSLANWLAANFPYLYGVSSSNNLTGKTNADVASLFMTFFGLSGQNTSAQVMGGALAAYVTNSNLAGSSGASNYGFNISTTGTGVKTSNVGSDGTPVGLSNNTSYTVLQLLQQANLDTQAGTFNATAFNDIFSNINQNGDIGGSTTTALSVTCVTVNVGQVGVAFNSGLMIVTGGTAPYTYSIVGTLPAGLTLNPSTGAITGIATAAGTFSVQVTDASGAKGTACPITIGSGYMLSVNPSNVTVVAGQTATTTFTFTPFGGYVGSISFACSGLPAGAKCTFSPASLTANGSNTVQNSTLTITTTASGTATISQNRTTAGSTLASIYFLPGLLFGGFVAWRRRSFTTRVRGMLLLILVGTMLIGGAVGCGSASYQTPVGAHVVTVVAKTTVSSSTSSSSSDSTQTANFTLTIIQ